MSVSPKTVDAGGDVAITVTTKPNAFVGVLAVDQRSLILGSENHLTQVRRGTSREWPGDAGDGELMEIERLYILASCHKKKGKGN